MAEILDKANSLLIPPLNDDIHLRVLASLIARLQAINLTPLLVYDVDHVVAPALPALGEQFHVMGNEGWIFTENDDQKRALIKRAIELHRHKGTPWAVEESIRVFGYETKLSEWYEYDGEPYCFRVDINLYEQAWDQRVWDVTYGLIWRWKNARSHLDRLRVYRVSTALVKIGSTAMIGETITVYPYMPVTIDTQTNRPIISATQQTIEHMTVYPYGIPAEEPAEITLLPNIAFNAAMVIDDDIRL